MFLLVACGKTTTIDPADAANPAGLAPGREGLSAVLKGTFAGVAADESRAAEVGRDALTAGNAVDAVVAMYFAQAVTLPSASSLGASGVCIVHHQGKRTAEVFGFPPTPAPGPIQGAAFVVPVGARAMTLMHVRHGQSRFEQLVSPAERLARFGTPVSRALARDLRMGSGTFGADPEARRVFGRGGTFGLVEGDNLVQSELATVLGSLRQTGGVDFFHGRVARLLADQIAQMGGSLPIEVLRGAVPISGTPPSEAFGGFRVHVAPAPFAGAAALAAWNGQAEPTGGSTGDSAGTSSFIAVDSSGTAAACSLSMGQLFGIRRIVPSTGILLGAATADAGAISPMVIGSTNNGEFLFAGGGGGSTTTAAAVGAVARATIQGKAAVLPALTARGGRGGHVNAIACPRGLRGGVDSCSGGSDPAGLGLALPALRR